MIKLIDKEQFRRDMYHAAFEALDTGDEQRWDSGCWIRYKLFERVLNSQPVIEPERKIGRWTDGHCSVCGCDAPAFIEDWRWVKDMDAKFCPMCGSHMEGSKE